MPENGTAVRTYLREIRKKRGISAAELAGRAGVSRQTIHAIEDGRFVPNTTVSLQLAHVLDVRVEEIFSLREERQREPIRAELLAGEGLQEGQLARVCRVGERVVAVANSPVPAYLPLADGIVESRTRRVASIRSASGLAEKGKRLLVAGCDPALSLLEDALRGSGVEIVCVPCSSRRALRWLKQGRVHTAGSHLRDPATGDYNLPIVRRFLANEVVRVVTFASWEQGLVVQRRNPKSIRSIADVAGNGVILMNRERGSGSRDLLDAGLRRFGILSEQVKGYGSIAEGHFAAVYAVASGVADCCIAPRAAARCFGLDFVPLAVERFDFSLTHESLEFPAGKALLDVLNHSALRKRLECIAGYDTVHTGKVLM